MPQILSNAEWQSRAFAVLSKRTAEWNKLAFPKKPKTVVTDKLLDSLNKFFARNPFGDYRKDAIELAEILSGKNITPTAETIPHMQFVVLKAKAPISSGHNLTPGKPYLVVSPKDFTSVGPNNNKNFQHVFAGEFEAASEEDVHKFVNDPNNLPVIKGHMAYLQLI